MAYIKDLLLCTIKKLFWTQWSDNNLLKTALNKAYSCKLEFMRISKDWLFTL